MCCFQKSLCPGRGGLGRSEWDLNPGATQSVHLSICRSTCPTGPDEWAGGWGLHSHPTNREGGGTSWWARVLWALIWVISGSPLGPAMWEGGIHKAYRIRCQISKARELQVGRGVPCREAYTHMYTCGHTHVRALQPARLGQLPHHFLDCMETVELVNPQIMPMAFCVPCI